MEDSRVRKKSIRQIREQQGRIMDEIRRRYNAGTLSERDAVRRSDRVMRRGADYTENIENRLRGTRRYQRTLDRVTAAYRNRDNDPQEYRAAYRENGDMYNNTAYSRRTYMGLSNG